MVALGRGNAFEWMERFMIAIVSLDFDGDVSLDARVSGISRRSRKQTTATAQSDRHAPEIFFT